MKSFFKVSLKSVFLICLIVSFLGVLTGIRLNAEEPIRIGAITATTGTFGFLGSSAKEVLEVEMEEVNKKGGVLGRQIEILFEDDQSNPTNSLISATKLIRDKKVVALIAPSFTAGCMAVIPICEQEQIPVMMPAPNDASFNKWVFNVLINNTDHGYSLLKYVAEVMKAKKIALLYGDSGGYLTGAKAIESDVGKYGVTITASEQYKMTDTNMVAQMTNIKTSKPDVLIFYGIASGATVAAKNYVQLGMTTPVVCSWGVASKDFAKLTAGDLLKGKPWIIFGTKFNFGDRLPANDIYRKNFDPFVKAYMAKWGHEAASYGTNSYDALHIILEAIKIVGNTDRAAIRDAIEKVKFQGLQGFFQCTTTNHFGMKVESVGPMTVKDGVYYPYKHR